MQTIDPADLIHKQISLSSIINWFMWEVISKYDIGLSCIDIARLFFY